MADDREQGGPPRWTTREERWSTVEGAIQQATRRGEFDDLPGAGKPLPNIDKPLDDGWWIRRKIAEEGLDDIPHPAIQLRREHAELAPTLDDLPREKDVRAHLVDFNRRVRSARLMPPGGPLLVTPLVDVDAEVAAWRERRARRR